MNHRSADEVWAATLGELQVQVTRANYETWLRGTAGVSFQNGSFAVGVPSTFAKEWLQKRLAPLIRKTVSKVIGYDVTLEFLIISPASGSNEAQPAPLVTPPPPAQVALAPSSPRSTTSGASLNPRYTFLTFVVGSANRFAHAAALGVSENPGRSYNPLFLYGGVGLGKTHLLHAIGHRCIEHNLRVLYVTSEQFTNEFINALRERRTEEFRTKYRGADVLLIDDIQFIADKEQTQESFFHTFNDLHNANRQIVVSSDRPPRSMPLLEDRLRSRFEWGLIADIQPPDLETRIAILQNKADELSLSFPSEVLNLIAHQFQSNVRELEGALNRVLAFSKAVRVSVTLEIATAALADLIRDPRNSSVSPAEIIEAIAKHFRLQPDDITGPRRSKDIAYARQIAMYLLRKETRLSLTEIGKILGDRDHSTIVHGYAKVSSAAEQSSSLHRTLVELSALVRDL